MKLSTIFFIGAIVATSVLASLLIRHQNEVKFRENRETLQLQKNQLTDLTAENQRLANQWVQSKTNSSPMEVERAELARLRAKAIVLQEQTSQLATRLAKNRRLAGANSYAQRDSNLLAHNSQIDGSLRGGPRATGKLNDARALTSAFINYANEHHGVFPSSFDQVTSYLPKPLDADSEEWMNAPLTGTNSFEIVFQGSQIDLTNIAPRRVALIREQQPWLTLDGKWARVYGFSDGFASTIASDDNFQSWDALHIVPPASDGPK